MFFPILECILALIWRVCATMSMMNIGTLEFIYPSLRQPFCPRHDYGLACPEVKSKWIINLVAGPFVHKGCLCGPKQF